MRRYRLHLFASAALLAIILGAVCMRSTPPNAVMRLESYPEPLALPAADRAAGAEAAVRAAEAAERLACQDVVADRPATVCEAR